MLKAMREFGTFVVVGVHDDASYLKVSRSFLLNPVLL